MRGATLLIVSGDRGRLSLVADEIRHLGLHAICCTPEDITEALSFARFDLAVLLHDLSSDEAARAEAQCRASLSEPPAVVVEPPAGGAVLCDIVKGALGGRSAR